MTLRSRICFERKEKHYSIKNGKRFINWAILKLSSSHLIVKKVKTEATNQRVGRGKLFVAYFSKK